MEALRERCELRSARASSSVHHDVLVDVYGIDRVKGRLRRCVAAEVCHSCELIRQTTSARIARVAIHRRRTSALTNDGVGAAYCQVNTFNQAGYLEVEVNILHSPGP